MFGEYSIIKHSMALAMPYPLFEGKLSFRRDGSHLIDLELKSLSEYIKKLNSDGKLNFDFDVDSFDFDVSQGLYFDSSIPQGFGVGSSGALVASIFDRYSKEDHHHLDIRQLKSYFSLLESHFHGSSSGVDPLISYLNSPILIKNKDEIGPVFFPKYNKGPGAIFLLNTKRSRKTEPLVNLFLEKCSNDHFSHLCEDHLTPITNQCINFFLNAEVPSLISHFKMLSEFQFQYFQPMIPTLYRDIWKLGIQNNEYFLKLCGAGGGGFMMGLAPDFHHAKKVLSGIEIRPIHYF